jgi:endoplasmic reticulum resident protein 44
VEIKDIQELNELDDKKTYVIGYFEQKDTMEQQNFKKAAISFKENCNFVAGFGSVVERLHPPSQDIVAFRPPKARSNDDDEAYTGDLRNYDSFVAWVQQKCNPVVREITFENAEELTEEGLPFLILFHHPDDTESVREYNHLVKQELMGEREQITFLTADGVKFAHPLHHLGKAKEDLPLIAIDSFRHMYLFPAYSDTKIPGKVKDFLAKLYSGQLHREFHYGPDDAEEAQDEDNLIVVDATGHIPRDQDKAKDRVKRHGPIDSQFKHLQPSDNRYSFRHDEF